MTIPIVQLPRKRLIGMDEKTVTLDLPESLSKYREKVDYAKVRRAEGILKGKRVRPLAYQRAVRSEWE